MANVQALRELDQRIAIARANLRQLTEQAAAISGGENEDRAAERIARLEQELARLLNEREALKS
jgi:predicted  nucleic acid-binding Zn-ribbon protein